MRRTLGTSLIALFALSWFIAPARADEWREYWLSGLKKEIETGLQWRIARRGFSDGQQADGPAGLLDELIKEAAQRARDEEGRDDPVPEKNEVVMTPGMTITATTPNGTIVITAGKGLKRSYTWQGATRSVHMWPREERWYGSLGLYFPGSGNHCRSTKEYPAQSLKRANTTSIRTRQ